MLMWKISPLKRGVKTFSFFAFFQLAALNMLEAQLVWTPASSISLPGNNALSPQVCVTQKGYANVVWSRANGSNFVVETSVAKIGGDWSSPFRLSYLGQNAFFPVIATDNNGNTTALWSRANGTNYVIQADSKPSHQNWSAPLSISGTGPVHGDAVKPQIGVDPQGLHVAIWHKDNGINNVIQCAQKRGNGAWDKPINLTTANPNGLGDINPQIAIDNNSNAIAVWINDSTLTLRGATRAASGKWSVPFDISAAGNLISSPTVGYDGKANVSVAWTRHDGQTYIVQTASKSAKGIFSAPVNLSLPGQDAIQPQLAVDASGNKVVVWHRFDGTNTIVQASIQPVRGYWSIPVDLSLPGQDASDPQVQIDGSGNIIVIWKRSDGSNFIIEATQSVIGSSSWTTPVALSNPGEDAMTPQLALSSTGNAVVAWQRSDGSNSIIQAAFGLTSVGGKKNKNN